MFVNENGNFACVSQFCTFSSSNKQELEIKENVEKKDKCVNIDKIFIILSTYFFLQFLSILLISDVLSKNDHTKTLKSKFF